MAKRSQQLSLLAKEKSAYGGDLLKTRAGRRHGRPLSTRETMHLVLRSTKAKGDWSFRKPRNQAHVNRIVDKFAVTYGVRVISMANVGNHLHLQIKLSNRFTYTPFIRAVTGAIAIAVTGRNRWTSAALADAALAEATLADATLAEATDGKVESKKIAAETNASDNIAPENIAADERATKKKPSDKFWDYRPFTRVVESFKAWLNLNDYMKINNFEGSGYTRDDARFMLTVERRLRATPDSG